jgi:hypothetical protein
VKLSLAFAVICGLGISTQAQASAVQTPRFQDYPVSTAFSGPFMWPPLDVRLEWKRSWTIIEAVKRIGKPNFAGHYVIAEWLYGSGAEMAVVDARSGTLYPSPFSTHQSKFMLPVAPSFNHPEYRTDSSLLIVPDACLDGQSRCYTYYFLWQSDQFRLLHKTPGKRNPIPLKPAVIGTWEGSWRYPDGEDRSTHRFRLVVWEREGRLKGAYREGMMTQYEVKNIAVSWSKLTGRMEIQGNCWTIEIDGDSLSGRWNGGKCVLIGGDWMGVQLGKHIEVHAKRVHDGT